MPQSHSQVWLHIVFSTKNRHVCLEEPEFRNQMFRMLTHHVKEIGCVVGIMGGHVDHIHLLVRLSRTIRICKLIEVIKTETSKWVKVGLTNRPLALCILWLLLSQGVTQG